MECSSRGVWSGFFVLHNFFVIVNLTRINTEYGAQVVYYKEPFITTLSGAINHNVLWSGYKVRPTNVLCPPKDSTIKEENVGGPPTSIPTQ